jgi:hypothetical protein
MYVSTSLSEPRTDSFGGPLTCPACGTKFDAHWEGSKTGFQHCPSCGSGWEATWPGFQFKPETVYLERAGDEPGHQPDLGTIVNLALASDGSLNLSLGCACGDKECTWRGEVIPSRFTHRRAR